MDALCGTSEVGFLNVAPLEPIYTKTSAWSRRQVPGLHRADQESSYICDRVWGWDIQPWNAVECGELHTGYRGECIQTSIQIQDNSLTCTNKLTPRMNSALCGPFSDSIHSYCDYGDNQCCSPYPEDGNAAHHNYVKKYNQDVVDFIKHRLATVGH